MQTFPLKKVSPEANPADNVGNPAESKSPGISAKPSPQPAGDGSAKPSPQPTGDSMAQPPLLTQYIKGSGVTFSELSFSQLILVIASGSDATVYCYDKSETGIWTAKQYYWYHWRSCGKERCERFKMRRGWMYAHRLVYVGVYFRYLPEA